MRRTLQQIRDAGFQTISGPNAWYHPEGTGQANTVIRIHIGGSIDRSDDSMDIQFVSIGAHSRGRRLSRRANEPWSLDTSGIDWQSYRSEMAGVLTTLGIAQ